MLTCNERDNAIWLHRKVANFQLVSNDKSTLKGRTPVKDRVSNDIGAAVTDDTWKSIDWRTAVKHVKNLRRRIYRAVQLEQWNKVRSLTKLLLRSHANLLVSVKRVTQENRGKMTAGIDGHTALTPVTRMQLVKEMKELNVLTNT